MKKALIILAVLAVAVLAWVVWGNKTQITTEDLSRELNTTVDDGGAADFGELQKSAEGL